MASYRVNVTFQVRQEIRGLPGNVRQRIFRLIQSLVQIPKPAEGRILDTSKLKTATPKGLSLHRLRVARWRIVYVIEETDRQITILAVRKRPPYQYDDLEALIAGIGNP